MKKMLTSLFAAALPAVMMAQPVLVNNDFYAPGDLVERINCDMSGITAGDTGASVTWDFSSLSAIGGTNTYYTRDTSATYVAANILQTGPGPYKFHLQQNSTDTYINAIIDSVSSSATVYSNYDVSHRPITYTNYFTDSFTDANSTSGVSGNGHVYEKGDGYGTLKLPTGIYDNVLRIRRVISETDTIGASGSATFTSTISYLWFDTGHHAPLLRLDSVAGSIAGSNTLSYLARPAAVANVYGSQYSYTAAFIDNDLILKGTFTNNKDYQVTVYDLIGSRIYSRQFTASGNTYTFGMGRAIAPGVYIVSVTGIDEQDNKQTFKIVKQ